MVSLFMLLVFFSLLEGCFSFFFPFSHFSSYSILLRFICCCRFFFTNKTILFDYSIIHNCWVGVSELTLWFKVSTMLILIFNKLPLFSFDCLIFIFCMLTLNLITSTNMFRIHLHFIIWTSSTKTILKLHVLIFQNPERVLALTRPQPLMVCSRVVVLCFLHKFP